MKIKLNLIYILLITFILATITGTSLAQTPAATYRLSGKIVDSVSGKPLSFITIRLKDEKGEPKRVIITKDSGTFVFTALPAMSYHLTVVAIGYQQKTRTVALTENVNMGVINLKQLATALKEVAITAERPIISQKADRIVYDLSADPESKGSSVLDMMPKIPFISLDASNNILLKGNSSYKVFIDGKPSSMVNNNLSTILRTMPASTIQKIEVITIPPAKYDAEGLAGIINIITVKKLKDGYSGTLNVNGSGPAGGAGGGGSFSAKTGKFGVSAFGGAGIYNAPQTDFSNSITGSAPATTLLQEGQTRSNQKNGYFGSQLSFEIDSLNLISGQFNINGNRSNGSSSLSSVFNGAATPMQGYNLINNNTGSYDGIDAALNYQMGFKRVKNRYLTLSYMYTTNPGDQNTGISFSNQVNQAMPDYQQHDHEKVHEQTVQLDFETPAKMVNIEAGIKAIFRNDASDFSYNPLNAADGRFDADPALSDQYTNTQNVFSAYNSYQIDLKTWNINAGLRLEQTVIHADFISSGAVASQNYTNVIPSLAVNKNFKDRSSFNFGLAQRLRRPGINRLNPYIDRSNPNIESSGNPNLQPVLITDLQAGYSSNKKLSVNISLDYAFVNNLDLKVTTFNPANQVTSTTYANVGRARVPGFNFNLGYPFTKWYNAGLNGNLTHLSLSGPDDGILIHNDLFIYSLAFSNSFQPGYGWRINAGLNVISRSPNGLQGTTNGLVSTALGLNKDLIKNKLNFAATIKNPLTKYRDNQNQTFGQGFEQFSTSRDYFRIFNASLNYNFGGLKDGVKKSKNEIRNDDLSN